MRMLVAVLTLVAPIFAGCATDSLEIPSAPEVAFVEGRARADLTWLLPTNVGPVVNTAFSEFDAFITRDGRSLYFVTGMNRPGGVGMRDLWVSERASVDDPWEAAVN